MRSALLSNHQPRPGDALHVRVAGGLDLRTNFPSTAVFRGTAVSNGAQGRQKLLSNGAAGENDMIFSRRPAACGRQALISWGSSQTMGPY